VGNGEHRWARLGLASLVALFATRLQGGPLAWGPVTPPGVPCSTGRPSARPADLSLVWVDVMGVARFAFPDASREIVSLLDRMDVRATVRLGDAHTVSTDSELTVIVLPGRPPGAKLDHAVMGATNRSSQGVRAIWVYADGVSATLGLHRRRGVPWVNSQRGEFAIALGRVVVHELVHAVAPRQTHVKGGLMAERMGRSLLLASPLAIDAATSEAFRAGLVGRTSEAALAAGPDSSGAGPTARP
jgi:hypothetical protein